MLSITHAIWRRLLVDARDGRQQWPSLGALAEAMEIGPSTVHRALQHPVEIGCVRITRELGVQVLDQYGLLLLFATHRRLMRDVRASRRVAGISASALERDAREGGLILGGCGALVAHLGENRITDYTTVVVYGDEHFGAELSVAAEEDRCATRLYVLEADRWLAGFGPVVPFAQAYGDVFSLPGWQSGRFLEELDPWTVASTDERVLVA